MKTTSNKPGRIANFLSGYKEKRRISKALEKIFKNYRFEMKEIKTSKTGNRSFLAQSNDFKIKIYSCWTNAYAINIQKITNELILGGINLPKIYYIEDNYVFSEWIEGKSLEGIDLRNNPNLLDKLARYQASIHKFTLSARISTNYYTDFLINRLGHYGKDNVDPQLLEKIISIIENKKYFLPMGIIHPDFTSRNLVIDKNENIYSIDNETLHHGIGKEFDILTTTDNFFDKDGKWQKEYINSYSKYDDLGTLISEKIFWNLIMMIKAAGSNFQKNNIEKGQYIIRKITSIIQNQ